ncbi:MAG TPA: SHOCT domain-containing protein [Isosphaeraceae bacterium]|nr:SHOCT domain-containing protein [Isosphaeraceae bacterium]
MQVRDIAIVVGVAILAVLLTGLLGGGMMMGWGMMGWRGVGFYPLGWILMLVFWGLVIGGLALLGIWLFRTLAPSTAAMAPPSRPLEILQERYARGEITREQYEEMRRLIEEK